MRRLLTAFLVATTALTALPGLADPRHDDQKEDKWEKKENKRERKAYKDEQKEDRRYWKDQDKAEKKHWKEQEKEGREHRAHRYDDDDDRDDEHGRRSMAPPWMNSYWRSGETRRYVALVPGDPSRVYVFLDGRWVLRQVRDSRARLDLEGAFRLPMAPPPIAPPRIGLDLHVVLFN